MINHRQMDLITGLPGPIMGYLMAAHSSVLAWRIPGTDGGAWWAAVYGVPQSRTRLT